MKNTKKVFTENELLKEIKSDVRIIAGVVVIGLAIKIIEIILNF